MTVVYAVMNERKLLVLRLLLNQRGNARDKLATKFRHLYNGRTRSRFDTRLAERFSLESKLRLHPVENSIAKFPRY